MKRFQGKTAVITGGAGGLGRAVAARLLGLGARVALWDVSKERLKQAVAALDAGDAVRGYAVDATDPVSVREAAKKVEADFGPVSLLDNNAGIVTAGGLLDASDADLNRTIDVNLKSYLWCTRAFLPGMIARGEGHLVMTASAAGLLGVPGMAAYSASKHGVVGLSESLRLELRKKAARGIGMTIVCPSFISTGMFAGVKPPRFTPWLTPDRIADRIIAAVERDRLYVREPFAVKLVPAMKAVPWVGLIDRLAGMLGMHDSMDGFGGT
ncbi:MAG: hypothetical protein AUJ52_00165 [Elusimicrobia bacterium CG1_02_63_36]|nr:MAG: hypothetical protein AUJ52_00165 [Elusimicrobia bacterium CG1_02_63_36]